MHVMKKWLFMFFYLKQEEINYFLKKNDVVVQKKKKKSMNFEGRSFSYIFKSLTCLHHLLLGHIKKVYKKTLSLSFDAELSFCSDNLYYTVLTF